MTWYLQVESVPQASIDLEAKFKKKVTAESIVSDGIQSLTFEHQYVVAPLVLRDPRTHVGIPVPDEKTVDHVKESIAPHFNRCLLFYEDDVPVAFTLSELKDTSRTQFQDLVVTKSLHPVIHDIYQRNGVAPDLSTFREKPVIYQISNEALTGNEIEGEQLKKFLQITTMAAYGSTSILPIGWKFGEHIKQSVYLKFLSSFCSEIYLYVWPSDGTVVCIEGRK